MSITLRCLLEQCPYNSERWCGNPIVEINENGHCGYFHYLYSGQEPKICRPDLHIFATDKQEIKIVEGENRDEKNEEKADESSVGEDRSSEGADRSD